MPAADSPQRFDDTPDVLDAVAAAIAELESHADAQVREAARVVLEGIDAVHRSGLTHLVAAIHSMAGDAFLSRLISDPAIRLLLASYGLIAMDRRMQAEEALDAVRGHLHAHGIDVEVTEVTGGVVYVRIHARHSPPDESAVAGAKKDIEAALTEGLVGFQELVVRDREPAPVRRSAVIPLSALRANKPIYFDVLAAADLPPGAHRAVEVNGAPLLLVNAAGEIHALRNRCGDTPLPLEFGALEETHFRCSWHGCLYDVRTGRRMDGEDRVPIYPVSIENGRVRVALGVELGGGTG